MADIEVSGTKFHYLFEGPANAPVVMLSNSLGTNLAMWDAQIPALTQKFRVLRYDTRGHGQTAITPGPYTLDGLGRDVVGLLDALHIERAMFCGLSMGGALAQWLGINAPGRVSALVVCNTAAKIGSPEMWNKRIETVRTGGMAAIAGAQVLRWFTESFVARSSEVIEELKQMLLRTSADGYTATCEALRDMDLRQSINRIRTRTLVISGAHDAVTPPAEGKFIAAQIPGAQFVELNAAHLSNIEDSAEFTPTLLRFLSVTEAR
jgi:3-oxoadipate enol-lactonase